MMKKLAVVLLCFGSIGCSQNNSKETIIPNPTPVETATIETTPPPTPTSKPKQESVINIDDYRVDEYYPVVEGVVTYPDGTTEEFNHGESILMLDGSDEYVHLLYEDLQSKEWLGFVSTKEEAIREETYFYAEQVNNLFVVGVNVELPNHYEFSQSSYSFGDIVDGVFGIEQVNNEGKIPYVVYRYSNHIPQDQNINDSFRIKVDEEEYYLWRMKEFDDVEGLDEEEPFISRYSALWWGIIDGDVFPPHRYTFEDK